MKSLDIIREAAVFMRKTAEANRRKAIAATVLTIVGILVIATRREALLIR